MDRGTWYKSGYSLRVVIRKEHCFLSQHISTRYATSADVPEIIELVIAQEQRLHALDTRLRVAHSREQVAGVIEQHIQSEEKCLVAFDKQGYVRGYVLPSLWQLSAESELLAFFTPINGVADSLILPSPLEEDTHEVVSSLLVALNTYWKVQHTGRHVLRWPSCDLWLQPLLKEHGFMLDSDLAHRPPQPLLPTQQTFSSPLRARVARADDEDVLVKLFEEELRFHEPYTPFVRISPQVISAFRSRLARMWAGEKLEDGAPLVVIVEWDNKIIAMAENDLLFIKSEEETGMLPAGCYGHLNNVSVQSDMRGRGVGRVLVQAVLDSFAKMHLDGYLLWFNPDNPLARSFWLHLGFVPIIRTYQRLIQE